MKLIVSIAAFIGIVLTTPGCGSDPSRPPVTGEPSSELQWQWFSPRPQGNDLHAVWVTEAGDVFAVGDVGTVLQSNGVEWELHQTGSNDRLTGVWAGSAEHVIVTTWRGSLLEYDGAKWHTQLTNSSRLNEVLGIGGSVYAVGHGGVVLRNDGGAWTEIETPFANEIMSIWGNAPDDLFVVGDKGLIAHYDGRDWQAMNSGTAEHLDGIWGFGPSDVYATGNGPTIRHYDGNTWNTMAVPVSGDIRSIWGGGSSSIFLVTREGEIARYDGISWDLVESSQPFLWSVRGNSHFAFAVGAKGRLLKYEKQGWKRLDQGPVAHVNGLWAVSDEEIYAVTDSGNVWHFKGNSHTPTNVGETCQLTGIWGSDAANIFTVGRSAPGGRWGGVIMRFDGSAWTQVHASGFGFSGVWGSSSNDVYAVGNRGEVVRYDGATWDVVFPTSGFGILYDVWGSGADDVFVVGCEITLDPNRLGLIRHFDGNEWSVQRIDEVDHFRAVWGRSPTDVYAVGDWSAIYHYDGESWRRIDVPWQRQLFSVAGFTDGDVFIGSNGGRIFRFDGVAVSEMPTGTGTVFNSIRATTSGVVWAAGGNGTVLRHLR